MVRDDELAATLERARDLGALVDGPRRERRRRSTCSSQRALAAGRHDRDPPRAHPPGDRRGRGDRPRRAPGGVHGRVALRRPRDVRGGGRGDRGRPAARRRRQRRDLHAVPRQHDRRPAPAGRRGLPLHLLAAAARRAPTTSRCGTTCAAACSRASRPTTARSTTSRRRRGLDDFSLVPNGLPVDPAPAREALGRGRRGRAHHAEPARRPHDHDDRAPLRPGRQGRDRAGQGRRHRRLRPRRAAALRRRRRRS